eukprot:g3057.t1
MGDNKRAIAHVDLDCFYCQVETKRRPELKGKPVAVVQYNEWQGGGIIALSYEAKACGVKRSMRGSDAKKLCPDITLITVPVSHEKADLTDYRDAGTEVFNCLADFESDVPLERTSIDEAYLDVTQPSIKLLDKVLEKSSPSFPFSKQLAEMFKETNNVKILNFDAFDEVESKFILPSSSLVRTESEGLLLRDRHELYSGNLILLAGAIIVSRMREAVFEKTSFTVSAGVSHNKLLAKHASGMNKPYGQMIIPRSEVAGLMSDLPLDSLNGLGGKLGQSLIKDYKIQNVSGLLRFTRGKLVELFGDTLGSWIYNASRGIDLRPVEARLLAKSVGCGKTFRGPKRLRNKSQVSHYLYELAKELDERLTALKEKHRRLATLVTVSFHTSVEEVNRRGTKVKITSRPRSKSFPMPQSCTDLADAIRKRSLQALEKLTNSGDLEEWSKSGMTAIYINASKFIDRPKNSITLFYSKNVDGTSSSPFKDLKAHALKKKKRKRDLTNFFCEKEKEEELSTDKNEKNIKESEKSFPKATDNTNKPPVMSLGQLEWQRQELERLQKKPKGSATTTIQRFLCNGEKKEKKENKTWQCTNCTLINTPISLACAICGSHRY